MSEHLHEELIAYLSQARALECQDLRLLSRGLTIARDEKVKEIYRSHRLETEAHLELIEERLEAHSQTLPSVQNHASVGALEIGFAEDALYTPTQLILSVYAFENLEIAVYQLLGHVADQAGDARSVAVVGQILEEEEQAAELLASTFDRALAASLTVG